MRQTNCLINPVRALKLLALLVFGAWCQPFLQADVVVLQDGRVLTGTVLQQDGEGVLIRMESGTHRYPQSWLRDVKKDPAAAPHISNNGERIPDWAQIVTLLANTGWSQGLKQVPATMIETGTWKNVPYISFSCRYGGYELNIFGDLNNPAAVQIGAMAYLKQSDEAKSNCVTFICSVLSNADDRTMVRGLDWTQKDTNKNGELIFETLMPGEWGSYGGWWVSVYSENALAKARASDAELLTLTQPPVAAAQPAVVTAQPPATTTSAANQSGAAAPQPPATTIQPPAPTTDSGVATTYYATPYWSAEELAAARRVTPAAAAAATPNRVYPRTYTRAGGAYAHPETRR